MSIILPLVELTDKNKEKCYEISCIQHKNRILEPYKITNSSIYLPFAFAIQTLGLKRPRRDSGVSFTSKFVGKLRDEQKEVKKEAIKYLNKDGCVLLALRIAFGKTVLSINLACTIKMKTLIVVHKLVLIKQWKESIESFCKGRIQVLNSRSAFDDECDFFIMNAVNIPKMGHKFFKSIGCLIVDECHCIMAEQISYLMNYIQPRYLIGLSATPYRNDDLNILLDLYFGEKKIIRKLHHPHKVFVVYTQFKPEIKVTDTGRVDYNHILDSLSKSVERNDIIIDIIKDFPDRCFLVLVKRLHQGNYLYERLLELGEKVDTLLGKKQDFDKNTRILIGTSSKVGTGFDHKKLDTLILAAPIKDYYMQTIGRIMRTKDKEPYVFDLVDKNPILLKHYKLRKEIYNETGGEVSAYSTRLLKKNKS